MSKHHHILNAASNLLGIALIIIAGLNVSNVASKTFADEVAWVAAILLGLSCLFSYLAIRADPEPSRYEDWADRIFIAGLILLIAAVVVLAAEPRLRRALDPPAASPSHGVETSRIVPPGPVPLPRPPYRA